MKKEAKTVAKISSTHRMEALLSETEEELQRIEPQIEKLEKQLEKLKELKLAKQKLITLKLSIKSILTNFSDARTMSSIDLRTTEMLSRESTLNLAKNLSPVSTDYKNASLVAKAPEPVRLPGTFLPDMAFNQVNEVLRKRSSLNYELFRAIVFNGGQANTEQIKEYLVEHHIKQPASGETFENVALTDISSRVNYLVRKGLVNPDGRGNFVSCLGWVVDAE